MVLIDSIARDFPTGSQTLETEIWRCYDCGEILHSVREYEMHVSDCPWHHPGLRP